MAHSLAELLCPSWARQFRTGNVEFDYMHQHPCSADSPDLGPAAKPSSQTPARPSDVKVSEVDQKQENPTIPRRGSQGNQNDGSSGNPANDNKHPQVCPPRFHLLLSYAGWQPDPWVDRLPRLLEPMGILSHRAVTGREASQLIQKQAIHVAVVDLGLPLDDTDPQQNDEFAEGGARLLELLSRLEEPPPVVVVKRSRTHRDDSRDIAAALRLGAFAVVDRPHDAQGLNLMLEVFRRCMARHYGGCWPGA